MGRLGAAIEQFRAATNMLALWPDSQLSPAGALVATGQVEEAKPYFDTAYEFSKYPNPDKWVAVTEGTETGEYAALAALRSPQFQTSNESRAALMAGYQALASSDPQAKTKAVQGLLALSNDNQDDTVVTLLAALGANREALQAAGERPWLF